MLRVTTETGSIYTIKNGRITREPSTEINWVDTDIENELFLYRNSHPLEVGKQMYVYLKALERPLLTSYVTNIEKVS